MLLYVLNLGDFLRRNHGNCALRHSAVCWSTCGCRLQVVVCNCHYLFPRPIWIVGIVTDVCTLLYFFLLVWIMPGGRTHQKHIWSKCHQLEGYDGTSNRMCALRNHIFYCSSSCLQAVEYSNVWYMENFNFWMELLILKSDCVYLQCETMTFTPSISRIENINYFGV